MIKQNKRIIIILFLRGGTKILYKLKETFFYFSMLFIISGITCFTAYNWNEMGNFSKMGVPLSLIISGVIGWLYYQEKILYRQVSLFIVSFCIGTLFAVFGQVYQIGADKYTLFRNWGLAILIFSYVERYYPLWALNISVLTIAGMLYSGLYGGMFLSCIIGSIITLFFLLIYIKVEKKLLTKKEDWFFYLISISSVVLMTLGMSNLIIDKQFKTGVIYFCIYIVFCGIIFFLDKRIVPKKGLNILNISSMALVIVIYVIEDMLGGKIISIFISICISIFISICIFIGVIRLISKNYLSTKLGEIIINFFKIMLIILILIFVILLTERSSSLIAGILLLITSYFLSKRQKNKEEKNEIVTFLSGMILIIIDMKIIGGISTELIVVVVGIIYAIFYIFMHSKKLDFLLIPVIILGIGVITSDWMMIINIPLIIILISCYRTNGERGKIKTITRGAEATVVILAITNSIINYRHIENYIYIENGIIFLITIILLYKIFQNKHYYSLIMITILIGAMNYFYLSEQGINIGIMLMLLYLYRNEKYQRGATALFLVGNISYYYYSLHITLLQKSYIMLKSGTLIFIVFFILSQITLKTKVKREEI